MDLERVVRKARKLHACTQCRQAILSGELYTEVKTGVASVDRHCKTCDPVDPTMRPAKKACPWCGSKDIDVEELDSPSDTTRISIQCKNCSRTSIVESGNLRHHKARQIRDFLATLDD